MHAMLAGDKCYTTVGVLGTATDTLDSTGSVVSTAACEHVSGEMLREKLTAFRGDIMQTPPAFSALKRGGEKLYEKARRGENVEHLLEPRAVTVFSLEMSGFGGPADAPALFGSAHAHGRREWAYTGWRLGMRALRRSQFRPPHRVLQVRRSAARRHIGICSLLATR